MALPTDRPFHPDVVIPLMQFAEMVNVHPDTVRSWNRKRMIKLLRLGERRLGVRASEAKRFLDKCEEAGQLSA